MQTVKLDIPEGDFAAYIFDLDGTLIDTMPLHYRAWDLSLRRAGLPHELDEKLFYTLGGIPTRRVAQLLSAHYKLTLDPDVIFHEKESLFASLQADARLIGPTVEFARRVAATHPVAIASGGPRATVRRSLEISGLAPLFRVVVTSDDVVHGKPAPDMFLLAAARMGVPPDKCLVFEDAEPGFKAAKAAGMACVQVPGKHSARKPQSC
jgi:HAD superfamily hydrolase (TIGR01509 family)